MSTDGVENNTRGRECGAGQVETYHYSTSLVMTCNALQPTQHPLPSATLHLYPFAMLCNGFLAFVKLKPSFLRQQTILAELFPQTLN